MGCAGIHRDFSQLLAPADTLGARPSQGRVFPAVSECFRLFRVVFQDASGCFGVFQDVLGFFWMFQGVSACFRMFRGVLACFRMFHSVLG